MRLKRVPQDKVFYERLSDLVSQMRQCNLVLAELSGIEISERRDVADRLREIGDRADEDMGAMLRALRENYITRSTATTCTCSATTCAISATGCTESVMFSLPEPSTRCRPASPRPWPCCRTRPITPRG